MVEPFGTTRGGVVIGTHDGDIMGHFRSEGVRHGTQDEPVPTRLPNAVAGKNLAMNRDGSVTFASVFVEGNHADE